jgi:thiamine transporter ThiT
VQIVLLALALVISAAALILPIGPAIAIGLWAIFFLTMIPLLIKIARRDPPVLLVAPIMIGVRALALGTGMFSGILRFHIFRAPQS